MVGSWETPPLPLAVDAAWQPHRIQTNRKRRPAQERADGHLCPGAGLLSLSAPRSLSRTRFRQTRPRPPGPRSATAAACSWRDCRRDEDRRICSLGLPATPMAPCDPAVSPGPGRVRFWFREWPLKFCRENDGFLVPHGPRPLLHAETRPSGGTHGGAGTPARVFPGALG